MTGLIWAALAAIIGYIALAKRGRGRGKRRMGRYIRGNIDEGVGIGTLAGVTLISTTFDETVNERTLVSSIVATWAISNWTAIASNGPFLVGVAHVDYSAAEIEAVIENTGSWDEGDLVQQEVANRKVRIVGTLVPAGSAAESSRLNDGRPVKTKLNWILNQGDTLQAWVYNTGSVATATTTPTLRVQGHANLWPR